MFYSPENFTMLKPIGNIRFQEVHGTHIKKKTKPSM